VRPDGPAQRRARIERALAHTDGAGPAAGLCRACTELVQVGGSSVMVMLGGEAGLMCASDAVALRLEDLQQTLGEGPCMEAHRTHMPVLEPDLAGSARWPAFAREAVTAGAASLFSFPMRIGAVSLGALSIYRAQSGDLTDDQYLDARAMAQAAAVAVVALQDRADGEELGPDLDVLASHRAEIHQAAGMVSVQLEVNVAEAMVRLRARAYADGRSLAEVAADVVARRLSLAD
jgi:hypothetical protein